MLFYSSLSCTVFICYKHTALPSPSFDSFCPLHNPITILVMIAKIIIGMIIPGNFIWTRQYGKLLYA